jgi:photosystem II stability/assembly factor-like uncharacterized protein
VFRQSQAIRLLVGVLLLALSVSLPASPAQDRSKDSVFAEIVQDLAMRSIGPAIMGGRVVDFAVVESNTSVIYAAIGPSGVWKSVNAGITWEPSFHLEKTVAVGAVDVSQSHPDIVWVGTGEGTSRNSVGIGDGVYKSEDGGMTWKNMGLKDTRHISQIIIDRHDPEIVYIGALGHLWGPNQERGVYKTTDGGKTWNKILYVNEDTGVADMAIDPSNSRILYAATWDYRRKPFHFRSGGSGSAIHKTTDGGETWKKIHEGLPSGDYGRIGLDVCRSRPEVVYALVENANSGIYRSEDKGETWRRMGDKQTYDRVNFRPFYYSKITLDPNNDLVVYVYSGSSYVSRDGGKTFSGISGGTHPDHHMIWVNPHNSLHLLDGNDGGIDISYDGGKSWHSVKTNPWSEVYQVGYDMRDPYYAYVGLQDNGSWGAPINSLDPSGIMNFHWYVIGGGDGFYIQPDPEDYSTIFRNAHMGGITRFDVKTGDSQDIKPVAPLDEPPYRFNWNSPILMSSHDRRVVYFGGNFLFKTRDGGSSWERISPDLSSNDLGKQKDSGGVTPDNTGAEIHCTIYTISESPLKQGLIWIGTDDGLVQLTQDSGTTWTDLTQNIKGLPPECWVTRIEASHFAEGTAYACFDRHRWDDYRPYVYKTEDYGRTWTSLAADLPELGYLHVVREDPVNPDLLYVGSEFGLFLSFDRGNEWIPFRNGFPTVAVRDIQVHPRDHDLLVGTHGRGLWVLDDITPLQGLTPEALSRDCTLFDIRPATLYSYRSQSMYSGPEPYAGPNPRPGIGISYFLKEKPASGTRFSLAIYDRDGNKVTALRGPQNRGLNQVYWNLRVQGEAQEPPAPSGGRFRRSFGGAYCYPGEYMVVLELGEARFEKILSVKADPQHVFTLADRQLNRKFVAEISALNQSGASLIRDMDALDTQLKDVESRLKTAKITDRALSEKLKEMKKKVTDIREAYSYSVEGRTGYRRPVSVALRGGTLPEQLSRLRGSVSRYQGAPTQTQIDHFNNLKGVVEPLLQTAAELRERDIPGINRMLNALDFPVIK